MRFWGESIILTYQACLEEILEVDGVETPGGLSRWLVQVVALVVVVCFAH